MLKHWPLKNVGPAAHLELAPRLNLTTGKRQDI